jgi:HAL2 family 3'(2'),5'-bisphosphate nucleotidase
MLEAEQSLVLDLLRTASQIGRTVQAEISLGRWDKQDKSPVTVADLAIQAYVGGRLQQNFPGDPLMAEEDSQELRSPEWAGLRTQVFEHLQGHVGEQTTIDTVLGWIDRGTEPIDPAERYWVLDPVDGTKGFLRREQYAVALALVERGEVILGGLACPNLPDSLMDASNSAAGSGQIFIAVRGAGSLCYPLAADGALGPATSVRVSDAAEPALARWCERVESSSSNQDLSGQVVQLAGITLPPLRLDSQAKYAVVARGEAALYLRHSIDAKYREKVWDHAAGMLVIEEAGGRVTDLFGRRLDYSQGREFKNNRGIVATNSLLHDRVLAAVRDVLAE